MSTAAVSPVSILQELQSFYQTRQSDLTQLGNDLKSGNLSGAQQDFANLSALGQSGPFANSEPFSNSTRAQAFTTLGQDLQAGNLTAAQADFATLTGSQNAAQASGTTPAAVVDLSSTAPATNATASAASGAPASIYQQLLAYRQQRQTDLNQLGQDLQAGDLSAAQQDFTALTTLGQSGPNQNGQTYQQTARASDFQAIGQALQNGDLTGAQTAFTSLAASFGPQSPQAQTAVSAYNSASNTPSGNTTVLNTTDITINLSAVSNAVGASGTSSSTTPEIVVSSGQGNVSFSGISEIVVNFGGTSGTTASANTSTPGELDINIGQTNNGTNSSSTASGDLEINLIGSGAQVNSENTPAQNNSTAQNISNAYQTTTNLDQTNNFQLILNLINTATDTNSANALSVSA